MESLLDDHMYTPLTYNFTVQKTLLAALAMLFEVNCISPAYFSAFCLPQIESLGHNLPTMGYFYGSFVVHALVKPRIASLPRSPLQYRQFSSDWTSSPSTNNFSIGLDGNSITP